MNTQREQEPSGLTRDERGQAATEYALVAFWTVFMVIAAIQAVQMALLDGFQDIASLICLPIP